MNTIITINLITVLALLALLYFVVSGDGPCLPIHGIDHNGKGEAFTIFLGWCA
jgi:hypothetical protein